MSKIKSFFLLAGLIVYTYTMSGAGNVFAEPVAGMQYEQDFTDDAFDAAISGAQVVFPYQTNKIYQIYAQQGYITDIVMQPGEKIGYVGGGDTLRWVLSKSTVGTGRSGVEHLYIKPIQNGLNTNLIINTDRRSYQINIASGNYYNPSVTWIIEQEINDFKRSKQIDNYLKINPKNLNFDYKFNKKNEPWAPVQIFDDGRKTYLKMKQEVFSTDMPAFFILDKKGEIVLVNYRVLKNTYIIDRVFERGQLVVGKEKIIIKRSKTL